MSRYVPLTAAAAGGGYLAFAFLQAAVAAAAPSDDAFTIGGTTFDPFTTAADGTTSPGFDPVDALNTSPPLLSLGGGSALGLSLAPQSFDVYSGSGSTATELGSIGTNESVASLFGLPNTEFTVTDVSPADGASGTGLPTVGTVYDVLNLGGGTYNVYTATPDDGTTPGAVTDTLVTKFGNVDLSSLFASNAANPLDAGAAFTGLQAAGSGTPDAFAIGNFTFDPTLAAGGAGFYPVSPLAGAPPLLNLGGGTLGTPGAPPVAFAPQNFDVSAGTGSSATDVGSITTGEDVTNLLGLPNTEFTVTAVNPTTSAIESALSSKLDFTGADFTAQDLANALAASENPSSSVFGSLSFGTGNIAPINVDSALFGSNIDLSGSGITDADIATALNGISVSDLPAIGTVYDVFNLGGGFANVYSATPDVVGADGTVTTPGTVTDNLVTPFGKVNLDSLFGGINAANSLDPGAAFTGLSAGNSTMPDAFNLGGFTFDPVSGTGDSATEGFTQVSPLLGAAPLLNLGGGTLNLNGFALPLDAQDFNVYGADGDELGSVTGNVNNVSTLLGLPNTEFTIASVTPTGDATDADLPTVGSVYDVLNIGGGFENIYIATPGDDGTVTDTLVTPFGNVDLSSLFDVNAANPLDPGDAVSGLDDVATSSGSAAGDVISSLGF